MTLYTFRATIRLGTCHDFVTEVRAVDQIQARKMLEALYGSSSIIGNCIYRV
jgi:hypothetical protein